jgi:putative membrane protein insertion efficiency factor
VLSRMLLAPIRFYRRFLSPLKRTPTCRFAPTCSEYAIEAIQKRGPVVGFAKALWRIVRCNPLCRGGYDPVEGTPCLHERRPVRRLRARGAPQVRLDAAGLTPADVGSQQGQG